MTFASVAFLFESDLKFDYEPLLRGFNKKNQKSMTALLKKFKPMLLGMATKMRGGNDPILDDWIADFVGQKLPTIVSKAVKNIDAKKKTAGQFPAMVSSHFRGFLLNKKRDAKLRKTREKEAGKAVHRQKSADPSEKIAKSDKLHVATIVKKYIDMEVDPEVRSFLMHLTGLATGSMSFGGMTGGAVNDALKAAKLDPKKWNKSGRPSKITGRLFKKLAQDKKLKKFMGVAEGVSTDLSEAEFYGQLNEAIRCSEIMSESFKSQHFLSGHSQRKTSWPSTSDQTPEEYIIGLGQIAGVERSKEGKAELLKLRDLLKAKKIKQAGKHFKKMNHWQSIARDLQIIFGIE